jgi:CDP-paratose 2-epimerase
LIHFGLFGLDVVGFDNDMHSRFFGPEASTAWNVANLRSRLGDGYRY